MGSAREMGMNGGRISGVPYKAQVDAWHVRNLDVGHNPLNAIGSSNKASSLSLNAPLQFGRQQIKAMTHFSLTRAAPASVVPLKFSAPHGASNVAENVARIARAAVLNPLVPPLVKAPLVLGLGTLAVVDLINRFHPTPFSRAVETSPLLGAPPSSSGSMLVYPRHQDIAFDHPGLEQIDPAVLGAGRLEGREHLFTSPEWNLLPGGSGAVVTQQLEGRQILDALKQADHVLLSTKANPQTRASGNTKNIQSLSIGDTEKEVKFYANFDPDVSEGDVAEAFSHMMDTRKQSVAAYHPKSN